MLLATLRRGEKAWDPWPRDKGPGSEGRETMNPESLKNYGPNLGFDYGDRLMAAWLDR